jgi:hypothetical protein
MQSQTGATSPQTATPNIEAAIIFAGEFSQFDVFLPFVSFDSSQQFVILQDFEFPVKADLQSYKGSPWTV